MEWVAGFGGLRSNAHVMFETLTTVAFERYGADLPTMAADSVEPEFEDCAFIAEAREGFRASWGHRRATRWTACAAIDRSV